MLIRRISLFFPLKPPRRSYSYAILLALTLCLQLLSSRAYAVVTWDGTNGVYANIISNNSVNACIDCHHSGLGVNARDGASVSSSAYDAPTNANFDSFAVLSATNTANYAGGLLDTMENYVSTIDFMPYDHHPDGSPDPTDTYTSSALNAGEQALMTAWKAGGYLENTTPTVTTTAGATSISSTGATIAGTVKENGTNVSVTFECTSATSGGCFSSGAASPSSPTGTGGGVEAATAHSRVLTGLNCGVTYNFNIDASGTNGTTRNFTTSACSNPVIQTGAGGALGASTTVTMSEDNSPTPFSLALQAFDADGGTRTWAITSAASNGNAGVSSPTTSNTQDVTVTYTVTTANLVGNSADSFQITVTDNTARTDVITVNVNLTEVNDAPTLNTNNAAAVIESGVVTIGAALLSGSDVDAGDNSTNLTYTIGTPTSRGTLRRNASVLSGGGTFTQDDVDNNLITYTETANSGSGSDTFTFSFTDDEAAGPTGQTFTINVTDNLPPVVVAGGTLNYTENAGSVALHTGVTVDDFEDDTIVGATVQITGNFAAGQDSLVYSTTNGVSGVFAGSTLTLSGNRPEADYQAALRAISYSNSSESPSTANRTVTYLVSDAVGTSTAVTRTISVTSVNDVPTITSVNAPATGTEDILTSFQVSFSDLDDSNNGTDITWGLSNAPTGMTISATGLIEWTPLEGVLTSGSVTVSIEDGNEDVSAPDTDTFSISVTPVNDPPQITSSAPTTGVEGTTYTHQVLVSDPDDTNNGSNITFTLSNQPAGMTVSNTGLISWAIPVSSPSTGNITLSVEDGDEDTSAPATQVFAVTVTDDDVDGDGVTATLDNCPSVSNADQLDTDADDIGDACDSDINNDGALDASIVFTTTQGANTGSFIFQNASTVTVTATLSDPDIDTSGLSYDWMATHTSITSLASFAASGNSISFDPLTLLDAGVPLRTLLVDVIVSDSVTTGHNDTLLTLKASVPLFDCNADGDDTDAEEGTSGDCDGDAIDNQTEQFNDVDNDGLPDYLDDAALAAHQINNYNGSSQNALVIEVDAGLILRLGTVARHADKSSLLIEVDDLANFGGAAGGSSSFAIDTYVNAGGIFNVEIGGVEPGGIVNLVLPLNPALSLGTLIRKFTESGWQAFEVNADNILASAKGLLGICPASGSATFAAGLKAFNDCLQLSIKDGGVNDADGEVNGVIRITVGPAIESTGESRDVPDPVEGGGSLALYSLLCLFLLYLFAQVLSAKLIKIKLRQGWKK